MPGTGVVLARKMLAILAGFATFGALACEPVSPSPTSLTNGVYCLDADVRADRLPAFTLGDDSVLDCRGHRIADGTSRTVNAVISSGRNVVLKHCSFDGFATPVFFSAARNYRIEGNTFRSPRIAAISAGGMQGLVAGNTISYPAGMVDGDTRGVVTYGDVDIIGNTVVMQNLIPGTPGEHIGILSFDNQGGVVAGNLVRDFVGPGPGWRSAGILVNNASVVYRNVTIASPGVGDIGIDCNMYALVLQNVVIGHPNAYEHCSPGGGGW